MKCADDKREVDGSFLLVAGQIKGVVDMALLEPATQADKAAVTKLYGEWMDEIMNGVEHTNFFENRVTEYTKAATQGSWDKAFA